MARITLNVTGLFYDNNKSVELDVVEGKVNELANTHNVEATLIYTIGDCDVVDFVGPADNIVNLIVAWEPDLELREELFDNVERF